MRRHALTPSRAAPGRDPGETMLTKQELEEERRAKRSRIEQEKEERGLLEAVIRDSVLSGIGRPDGPHRVQVTRVWGGRYRVNGFVGPDVASVPVAHSYFLEADGDGRILSSSPAITRVFGPAVPK